MVTGAEVDRVTRAGAGIVVALEGASDRDVRASHLLVAVGRRPNTDALGLEEAGVELDDHGYIQVLFGKLEEH